MIVYPISKLMQRLAFSPHDLVFSEFAIDALQHSVTDLVKVIFLATVRTQEF